MTAIPDGYRDLFDRQSFAHVATLLPNGMPHVTPTWIDADDEYEHVLINTARTRRKERNLRGDPSVGLSILDPEDSYRYLSLWGEAVELTEEGAGDHIDELARQYFDVTEYPSYDDDPGPRVIVRPTRPRRNQRMTHPSTSATIWQASRGLLPSSPGQMLQSPAVYRFRMGEIAIFVSNRPFIGGCVCDTSSPDET